MSSWDIIADESPQARNAQRAWFEGPSGASWMMGIAEGQTRWLMNCLHQDPGLFNAAGKYRRWRPSGYYFGLRCRVKRAILGGMMDAFNLNEESRSKLTEMAFADADERLVAWQAEYPAQGERPTLVLQQRFSEAEEGYLRRMLELRRMEDATMEGGVTRYVDGWTEDLEQELNDLYEWFEDFCLGQVLEQMGHE